MVKLQKFQLNMTSEYDEYDTPEMFPNVVLDLPSLISFSISVYPHASFLNEKTSVLQQFYEVLDTAGFVKIVFIKWRINFAIIPAIVINITQTDYPLTVLLYVSCREVETHQLRISAVNCVITAMIQGQAFLFDCFELYFI